jgi:hypothetical protein
VSATDKDRPYRIQIADPLNHRFKMVTGNDHWHWKKMHRATQCWCCSNRAWLPYKRKRRSGWKRELLGD